MGLRADTTPQVARIDAHLLNRKGVTRLCYCGPGVAHAPRPPPCHPGASSVWCRDLWPCRAREADLEALQLARECLRVANVRNTTVDLADVRIVRNLLAGVSVSPQLLSGIHAAWLPKMRVSCLF
jgi:ATP phosphoribosyltransferase regulatory subunit